MKLVIVESPAKAKTIEKYLKEIDSKGDFVVRASVGHVRDGPSAGRVQSPALRILMEREREIRAFVPETFYVITAQTKTPKKEDLLLTCAEEPRDKQVADKIIAAVKQDGLTVADVSETEAKRAARPPFTTSTLQQTASSRLGYSPSNTMRIAQKLYEAGHITYMRTDSPNLGKAAQAAILALVEKEYGKEYAQAHIFAQKSKNAQEAHEAIRPTHADKASLGTTPDQKKLYNLIRSRALASQMADAKILRTKIASNLGGKSDLLGKSDFPAFAANGSRVLFDGWLKADPDARGEDVELPKVTRNEKLKIADISAEEKQTTRPPRYTEAG